MESSGMSPADFSYLDQYLLPDTASAYRELDSFYDTLALDDQRSKGDSVSYSTPTAPQDSETGTKNEKSWKAESPPSQTSDAQGTTYVPTGPSFDAKVIPPNEYFDPKKGLFWDHRDYDRPWYRRKSYDELSHKPSNSCITESKSGVGSDSGLQAGVSQPPKDEASSVALQGLALTDEVAETPVSPAPTKSIDEVSEEKGTSVIYQAPAGSILPSRHARSTSISTIIEPAKPTEARKNSDLVSEVPFEHSLIFGGTNAIAPHTQSLLPEATDKFARAASLPCADSWEANLASRKSSLSAPHAIELSMPADEGSQDPPTADHTGPPMDPMPTTGHLPTPVETHPPVDPTDANNDQTKGYEEMDEINDGPRSSSPVVCTSQTSDKQSTEYIDQDFMDDCESEDEVTLVSPIPIQPQVQMPSIASVAMQTPECDPTQPKTPLQPRTPTAGPLLAAPMTPCPPPTEKPLSFHNKPVNSRSPSLLSPDAQRKKGIKGVFSSPKLVPPPNLSQKLDSPEKPAKKPIKEDKRSSMTQEVPRPSLDRDGESPLSDAPFQSTCDTEMVTPENPPPPSPPPAKPTPKTKPKRKYTKPTRRRNEIEMLKSNTFADSIQTSSPKKIRNALPDSPATQSEASPVTRDEAAMPDEAGKAKAATSSKKRGRRRSSLETGKPTTRSEKRPRRSARISDGVEK